MPSRNVDTRTFSLPSSDDLPRTGNTYSLHGTRMNGDFGIGASVRPEDEGTIDDLPLPVYDALSEMADAAIDMDRLRADTTAEKWPIIGSLTTSRGEGDTVDVAIEWIPVYRSTGGDDTR